MISWLFIKMIYAPITSNEYHAWFHMNAASPAARNMEQVNITKKILLIVGLEPSHGKETSLQVNRLNRSANSQLLLMKKLNVHLEPINIYIYAVYQ